MGKRVVHRLENDLHSSALNSFDEVRTDAGHIFHNHQSLALGQRQACHLTGTDIHQLQSLATDGRRLSGGSGLGSVGHGSVGRSGHDGRSVRRHRFHDLTQGAQATQFFRIHFRQMRQGLFHGGQDLHPLDAVDTQIGLQVHLQG